MWKYVWNYYKESKIIGNTDVYKQTQSIYFILYRLQDSPDKEAITYNINCTNCAKYHIEQNGNLFY